MTEPEQRPTPTDNGHGSGGGVRAEEPGAAGSRGAVGGSRGQPVRSSPGGRPPGPETARSAGRPQQPSPWGPPPANPYGKVRPGPVRPWGSERPREPERPHCRGAIPTATVPSTSARTRADDPERRYRDQREAPRSARSVI